MHATTNDGGKVRSQFITDRTLRLIQMLSVCIASLVVGFIVASAAYFLATSYNPAPFVTSNIAARPTMVHAPELDAVLSAPSRKWLVIHLHVQIRRTCPSLTQHIIFRSVPLPLYNGKAGHEVVPLGITPDLMTAPIDQEFTELGRTEAKSEPAPPQLTSPQVIRKGTEPNGEDFDLIFRLPDIIASGRWYYFALTTVQCEWLPGLVRQQIQRTEPVPVDVPSGTP